MTSPEKHTAIISLGSNIEPKKNIPDAIRMLSKSVLIRSQSKLVQTKPLGFADQPDFTNGSVLIETCVAMPELVNELKKIENALKRVRTRNKNGPRTIDLDIVVWDGEIVDRDVYERSFLLKAVLELLPDLSIPEARINHC